MKMVEDDKSCEEILIQISSAKSALHMVVLNAALLYDRKYI